MKKEAFHPKQLGFNLKSAREAADYKQSEFAKDLGISVRTLTSYENGNSNITVALLFKAADLLGSPVTKLLQIEDSNIVNSFNNAHEQAFANGDGVNNKVEMSRDWMESITRRFEFLEQQIQVKDQRINLLETKINE